MTPYEQLSPRDFARERNLTLGYVYSRLWAGRIPGARKRGKRWVIPRQALKDTGKTLRQRTVTSVAVGV